MLTKQLKKQTGKEDKIRLNDYSEVSQLYFKKRNQKTKKIIKKIWNIVDQFMLATISEGQNYLDRTF